MIRSLNLGLIFIFKSSTRPKRKNNVQNDKYSGKKIFLKKYKYKKNHSKYDFVEPIYAFVPSVALSQIIKVPESFSSKWKNNYLITSLRALSIYRIMFDENYSRIITMEKIRIGKRIRDIAYNKKYNLFLLALENETGSIGLISAN